MKYIELSTPLIIIENLLKDLNFLEKKEKILKIDIPGEGNMNLVIRVYSNLRTFIIKQSRPFVQKYPSINAPLNRIKVEKIFFEVIKNEDINKYFPEVLLYNENNKILILKDLVNSKDMLGIYNSKVLDENLIIKIVKILEGIHSTKIKIDYPLNYELRKLNYEHIFIIPYSKDNNLEEGLKEAFDNLVNDKKYIEAVMLLSNKYLEKGDSLLHGDYYPGSWLKNDKNEIFVIDPEFSYLGLREFDLGVMSAHLIIKTGDLNVINRIKNYYKSKIQINLMRQFAGIEIIRRILGVAKLPINRTINEKINLIKIAKSLVV